MKQSAFFFDIDGTIATYQCPISEQLKKKILELRDRGHGIFICTGRGYSDIPGEILSMGFHGYICSTGAYVRVGDKVLHKAAFPREFVDKMYGLLRVYHLSAYFESDKQIFRAQFGTPLEQQLPSYEMAPADAEIYSIAYHLGEGQELDPILPYLEPLQARAIPQAEDYGDIVMPGCNKAFGMELLLRYLGLEGCPVIAFGDSPNDVEMLTKADMGIAMGHAPQILKEAADAVTGTFREDGVYQALCRLFSQDS